ncbi:serine hydrolase domain-containing protein [Hymenobacter endophyticus]|uniref:Serine hydrolase domain-containing protein n=1 Tax=Hymenobacter endophyticus TaxID=3076335 RepID=A0ABU3TF82_9BACT|nr:serine hydrolase domain-containing protein [Hymenobacter endophyticus]MDU0370030.1 serine hydrolase domain-containing protein [Hymenobacter endophyticus]
MRYFLLILLSLPQLLKAQHPIERLLVAEANAGHFSGAALVIHDGKVVARINRGYANRQFSVPVSDSTRFPVASLTKTFTAVLALQLQQQGRLKLTDKVTAYLPELPPDCRDITLLALLTHYSGLRSEPVSAYAMPVSTAEFVRKYVAVDEKPGSAGFHYNNVDYILLTRVLEVVTGKSYARLLQEAIIQPLKLKNTGVVQEAHVIRNLAYGYHNYSFGVGTPNDTLYNDTRYLSNYAGAGAIYSTVDDLRMLVEALRTNRLLRPQVTAQFLIKPQQPAFIEYTRGYPTVGFYLNNKSLKQTMLERRGSIDGFNSLLLTTPDFTTTVIILTNTDTGDLEKTGDAVWNKIH